MTTTRQTVARVAVAFLTMSASGYATWQASEGFTERPMIPTAGDVPTIGHLVGHHGHGWGSFNALHGDGFCNAFFVHGQSHS